MNIVIGILFGILGTVAGFGLGAAGAAMAASAFHMSSREGAIGYFAGAVGILVGLVSMVAAIAGALRWRGVTGIGELAGNTVACVAGIPVLTAAGLGLYWAAQPHILVRNGPTPLLEYQIQPPAGVALPDASVTEMEIQTKENTKDGSWDRDKRPEFNGRPVLAGSVQLYYRTSQRLLVLKLPNRRLRLPADPTGRRYQQWSEWQPADFSSGPETQPVRADPRKAFQVRYQVETYEQR